MATIGTFKKTGSNEFTGEIVTLSVQAKNVRIVPDQRATGERAGKGRDADRRLGNAIHAAEDARGRRVVDTQD